ncbi:hypothetical protein ADZ36_06135 [Streptomyces fradiae]|nr:hypothetical protein [Streptomyces fradiae]KNE83389.1 hypothetical protein ADZ36_06135 [Streptomyces fradiae]
MSLLQVLEEAEVSDTPVEHTVLNGFPLYVRVADSRRHGRVVQFAFGANARDAAASFSRAALEGATGEQVLRAVKEYLPQQQPTAEPAPIAPERLRENLLKLVDDPDAPSEPALQGTIRALPLYVAVNPHPQHGRVVQFGFDPKARQAAAHFTRADLQRGTNDKVAMTVERHGTAFVQNLLDTDRARRARDHMKAAALARQSVTAPAAPGLGRAHQPLPGEHTRHTAPAVSHRR